MTILELLLMTYLNPIAAGPSSPILGSPESPTSQPTSLTEQKYEFLSVDNRTFEEFNFDSYPQFLDAFSDKTRFFASSFIA